MKGVLLKIWKKFGKPRENLSKKIVNPGIRISGLQHGQEKSGQTKKNDKSQEKSGKNRGFWKKSRKVKKKHQILSVQIYKTPCI